MEFYHKAGREVKFHDFRWIRPWKKLANGLNIPLVELIQGLQRLTDKALLPLFRYLVFPLTSA